LLAEGGRKIKEKEKNAPEPWHLRMGTGFIILKARGERKKENPCR